MKNRIAGILILLLAFNCIAQKMEIQGDPNFPDTVVIIRINEASTAVGLGVIGPGFGAAIIGKLEQGTGLYGQGDQSIGVHGRSQYGTAVRGDSEFGQAVFGSSTHSTAIDGRSVSSVGIVGYSGNVNSYDFNAIGPGINYGSTSSRRWKQNITHIPDPLIKISHLRGVYFDWDDAHGGHHDVGFIAEEVGEVLPEIVVYEKNGTDASGLDYSKLTPLLVEAVNALQKKIEKLENLMYEQQEEIRWLKAGRE